MPLYRTFAVMSEREPLSLPHSLIITILVAPLLRLYLSPSVTRSRSHTSFHSASPFPT